MTRLMKRFQIRIEFVPEDLWIGVFWKRTSGIRWSCLDIWI